MFRQHGTGSQEKPCSVDCTAAFFQLSLRRADHIAPGVPQSFRSCSVVAVQPSNSLQQQIHWTQIRYQYIKVNIQTLL